MLKAFMSHAHTGMYRFYVEILYINISFCKAGHLITFCIFHLCFLIFNQQLSDSKVLFDWSIFFNECV